MILKNNSEARQKVKVRVRKKITGTPERPRLCVFRSLLHIYAQIVDDSQGKTLVHSSSLLPALSEQVHSVKGMNEVAKIVGKDIATKAKEKNISTVVFDRSGYLYHGNVKALADGARESGLRF
ncbi:MAG: 50S ribosomal protein L18 [Ignavibacteriales bacterium]|nr:50S ribosomal protein L18 [Ignavibacteriales bacterium]